MCIGFNAAWRHVCPNGLEELCCTHWCCFFLSKSLLVLYLTLGYMWLWTKASAKWHCYIVTFSYLGTWSIQQQLLELKSVKKLILFLVYKCQNTCCLESSELFCWVKGGLKLGLYNSSHFVSNSNQDFDLPMSMKVGMYLKNKYKAQNRIVWLPITCCSQKHRRRQGDFVLAVFFILNSQKATKFFIFCLKMFLPAAIAML